ncbi:MAG: valine--tRNA ligase [Prolixibacteraceae bacterium]|jgi:valyl-tRNA synthetase|nr:valine--tRNA ligase [Prolixibacteraceae bacterium]MDI9562675.1 valine--tRNA ligase [Bacteroidota bacterium]NLT00683.1 valine--tRNA ligase [Bacteroidales bacterium]OQB78851.1 MAG: Valine--tRNA ligase [Bacteroidetes bacterium ADurb.Bin123]HNZ68964.1 valine--tRNA ligase [Prolixibacteraceae bacterium]
MEIQSKYNPAEVEAKWYRYWMDQKLFRSVPDEREPYTIVIPPPNVTGVLHMGHMLNNTIQDILIRRARMTGKNACWVPGTDHASIATEAKVVNKLREQGIDKRDIGREVFLEHAWNWTHKHGGIILEQLKKLGASCDWDRTCFTMDDARSESVIRVFVDLFNKGDIYRGVRMVNWDPKAKTALSDEEVIYKEVQSKLYYLRYLVEGTTDQYVTIATTRPETILGDTAVCVNPADERFRTLVGKKVLVPLINRPVPVIEDEYVDMEFGTGCLKITPAHDPNDYLIGMTHNLESVDIFNDDGTLSEKALLFIGEDRFDVREKIVPELEKAGNLVKIEDYTNKIGFSERTDVIIEPKLSAQWFLKMEELVKPALDHVMDDTIRFHPAKFKNIYRHWMDNVKDWCISRQLWWGHRIPVYYLADGSFVVASTAEEALTLAREKAGNPSLSPADLQQDEDVLDTWFSSWLWPISVFDGINHPENEEIQYYYPSSDLITAPDIIFFWVARMIIAGYEYRNDYPFKNVYYTGMVRDKLGRKMSKSLGNSPEPLNLIDRFGADGVRVGMLLCSPAGGDLLFDESLPQQGANFATKIWNAFRLVKNWPVSDDIPQPEHSRLALEWFHHKLNEANTTLDDHFRKFRISDALMLVYTTFRDEFSGWLLEIVKPAYQKPIDSQTFSDVTSLFDKLLRMIHPFMPFITEEIWQLLSPRKTGASIMVAEMPLPETFNTAILDSFENMKEAVSGIRKTRLDNNIAQKEPLELFVQPGDKGYEPRLESIVKKLGNLDQVETVTGEVKGAFSFRVKSSSFYIAMEEHADPSEELKKLEEELTYAQGFLSSVMKKLENERFVASAPEAVVEKERAKQADTEAKIKILEERIAVLKG